MAPGFWFTEILSSPLLKSMEASGPLQGFEPRRSGSWARRVTKVLLLGQIRYLYPNRAEFPGGSRARNLRVQLWRFYDSRWLMFLFAWRVFAASVPLR